MITKNDVAIAEYIVDSSGNVETIWNALRTDRRGRKSDSNNLRLLLIGLFLSIREKRSATVEDAFDVLTKVMPTSEQIRLGIKDEVSLNNLICKSSLYYVTKCIKEKLNYGLSREVELGSEEVTRRRAIIQTVNDAQMDVFALGWKSDVFALDATGLWSWMKSKIRGVKGVIEDAIEPQDGDDEQTLIVESGQGFPVITADELSDEERYVLDRQRSSVGDAVEPKLDDAAYGYKTANYCDHEIFYGLFEHTLVQVPGDPKRLDDEPRLIVRYELTPASEDVVKVSLGLLDRMNRVVRDLIVDAHYHYKIVKRWLTPLTLRGISQCHDLREDERNFIEFESMRVVGGSPHCPCTPDSLDGINPPGPGASRARKEEVILQINKRRPYALRVHTQPDATGKATYECPALAGQVGCPLRPGTVQAAIEMGLPIVENPPSLETYGGVLPKCCTQKTVTVTLPERLHKLSQRLYWCSREWMALFALRTYVEGSYGNRKNSSTENLNRNLHRFTNLAMANIVMSLVNSSYNLRMLQNWHKRHMKNRNHKCSLCEGDLHPLLLETIGPEVSDQLTVEEFRQVQSFRESSIRSF
jgi:hypothetical protein